REPLKHTRDVHRPSHSTARTLQRASGHRQVSLRRGWRHPTTRAGRGVVAKCPHFDAVTLENSVAASGGPAELRPARAIATIPIARIEPRRVFALTHPSNSRGFF